MYQSMVILNDSSRSRYVDAPIMATCRMYWLSRRNSNTEVTLELAKTSMKLCFGQPSE